MYFRDSKGLRVYRLKYTNDALLIRNEYKNMQTSENVLYPLTKQWQFLLFLKIMICLLYYNILSIAIIIVTKKTFSYNYSL